MGIGIAKRRFYIALFCVVVLLLFFLVQPILMPFVVGALFAYLLDPLADKLEKLKLSRTLAVSLIFLLMSTVLFLVLLILVPALLEQISRFLQRLPQTLVWLQSSLLPYIEKTTGMTLQTLPLADLQQLISEHWRQASTMTAQFLKSATSSTLSLATVVANILLIPVVGFYLLRDWDILMAKIRAMMPNKMQAKALPLVSQCDEVLSAFIRGQLLVMLALGVIYTIGLSIIGVDLALFIGALAGLASIVPYLGFIIGIVVASIAAYMQFHEWMPLLWVLVLFGVGQVIESVLLTPWLVGDKIGLHPVAVIFAIMAGGQIAGFMGVLIALPVAAVLMVFVRYYYQMYQQSLLEINDEP